MEVSRENATGLFSCSTPLIVNPYLSPQDEPLALSRLGCSMSEKEHLLPSEQGILVQSLSQSSTDSDFIEKITKSLWFGSGDFSEIMTFLNDPESVTSDIPEVTSMQRSCEILTCKETKSVSADHSHNNGLYLVEALKGLTFSFDHEAAGGNLLINEKKSQSTCEKPPTRELGYKKRKIGVPNTELDQRRSDELTGVSVQTKDNHVYVRARKGQATNKHSLTERARREKINEKMKILEDLVPGCKKVNRKALMLDEIISYVQSLQQQVEYLSMKLATFDLQFELNTETLLKKI